MKVFLDEGQLKDSHGWVVNFKNTIIIMTSNIGAQNIIDNKKENVLNDLNKYLKPEFINRIDEIVIFNSLTETIVEQISEKLLIDLAKRLDNEGYRIEFDKKINHIIAKRAFSYEYGARPLKRWIQKNIENNLATAIIDGKLSKSNKIKISFNDQDDKLIYHHVS